MKIVGNTFLVTGGSSGLGEACVRRLVEAGAKVVIADVNSEAGDELAEELGENAYFIYTDVSGEENVRGTVGAAVEMYGGLHGVVNCAGIAIAMKVLSSRGIHDLEAFSTVIKVNLIGTFNVTRLAAEAMAQGEPNEAGERGVIINTASVAAFEGQIGQAAYSASKGGVVAMTMPIARELARYGIRVVTIAPGLFDTPMMAGLPEKARESLAQHVIENEMLNGEVIRLDGAIRMAPR
jgi:NAD(P)-dependent dehydrogenase (short-subunit alcohol dehydrogenase family)